MEISFQTVFVLLAFANIPVISSSDVFNTTSPDYYGGGIGCRTVMLGGGQIFLDHIQPGLWDSNQPYCADIFEEHAVRCCSDSFIPDFTETQCNGNTFWSETHGLGCIDNVNYSVAVSTCESVGARLCNATEMYNGCTQGSGCNFDLEYAWTSTEEWVEFEGSFYRYFDTIYLDFTQAEVFCEEKGAHLVTLTSQDENDFVWFTLIGGTNQNGGEGVWIGANDRDSEGNYVWVEDGSSVSYTNWGASEPNDFSGNEDCVHLGIFYGSGLWNDAYCSSSLHFICEIGATDHQPTVTPNPTSAPTVTPNDQPTFAPTGDADPVESYSYSFSYSFVNEGNNNHPETQAPKCAAGTCGSNTPVCSGLECCHCDDYCTEFGDCCADYLEVCERKESSDGFCDGSCGTKSSDNCWCDEDCVDHGDCCSDACESCGYNCQKPNSLKPQCVAANCGSNSPICNGSECCYCDNYCKKFGDCCSGFSDICS